jgi:hypothetical protein
VANARATGHNAWAPHKVRSLDRSALPLIHVVPDSLYSDSGDQIHCIFGASFSETIVRPSPGPAAHRRWLGDEEDPAQRDPHLDILIAVPVSPRALTSFSQPPASFAWSINHE